MKQKNTVHPAINDLKVDLDHGRVTRRQFLRYATLLGMSVFTAGQLAGMAWPQRALAAKPVRGGKLRISGQVHKITHPARFSWISPSQVTRQVAEYLTWTDGRNITHPYLLRNWAAGDDLKTWTLNLRQGIKWNNGDTLTADDVVFSFNQWMNKDVGSSMLGLVGKYLDQSGIEKVDNYQIRLHLKTAEIAVPEHLFHYPAVILNHKTFEGDFIKKPVGTGAYALETYLPGERALVKRRSDYWQKGADGQSLPYIEEMEFIDMGNEMPPQIAAIKAGEIDMIDLCDSAGVDVFQVLGNDPHINMVGVTSSATRVLRMRVDVKPWDDNRVRTFSGDGNGVLDGGAFVDPVAPGLFEASTDLGTIIP